MLNRISQLGKNLSEEFTRNLEPFDLDAAAGASGAATPTPEPATPPPAGAAAQPNGNGNGIDMDALPAEIRSKLKKFQKYEAKYPLLLDAYKTEKAKSDRVALFEKMLQETTPCSGIEEPDALKDYLESLQHKNTMLNEELTRVRKEKDQAKREGEELKVQLENNKPDIAGTTVTDDEVKELKEKLEAETKEKEDVQAELKALKNTHEEVGLKLESQKLLVEQAMQEKDSAVSELKTLQELTTTKITDLESEVASLKEENTQLKSQVDQLESDKKSASPDGTAKDDEITQLTTKLTQLESQIKEKDTKIGSLTDEISKLSISTSKSIDNNTSPTPSTSKKNKKKKKKGKQTDTDAIKDSQEVPESEEATPEPTEIFQLKFTELETTHKSTLAELQSRNEEIESLRDMVKTVGDDLVTARDEVKELQLKLQTQEVDNTLSETVESQKVELEVLRNQHSQAMTEYEKDKSETLKLVGTLKEEKLGLERQIEEKNVMIKDLEKVVASVKSECKSQAMELNALSRVKGTLEKNLESVKAEKNALLLQKQKLEQDSQELDKLKKEYATLASDLSTKDKVAKYQEEKIREMDTQNKHLSEDLSKLKIAHRELNVQAKHLSDQLNRMGREKQQLSQQAVEMKRILDEQASENRKLLDKVTVLQDKYDALQETKSYSSDQLESIKRQCEELSISSREAHKHAERLEEELSDARTMLQERTREATTIRRLLMERDQDQDQKIVDLTSRLNSAVEEKERLISENAMSLTRKQRELDEIRLKNTEMDKLVKNWSEKEAALTKELYELRESKSRLEKETQYTTSSSDELTSVVAKLRDSLSMAEKKVREYENLNNVLKKLNEELSSKMDRLSKNYKMVTTQLKELKTTQQLKPSTQSSPSESPLSTRSNSVSNLHAEHANGDAASAHGSSETEKLAYIKNVLLGFLEHRDQRQQLLPVISMLLQLSKADEKRFVTALR